MTIIGEVYGPERRGRIQGYFSSVRGVASLVGPLFGGLVADNLSWRWVFYLNLPPGLLAVLAIARGLAPDGPPARRVRIDYAGMAIFSLAIASLLLGLLEGGRRGAWLRPEGAGLILLAAGLLALFVRVERRAAEPLIPFGLFRVPMVRATLGSRSGPMTTSATSAITIISEKPMSNMTGPGVGAASGPRPLRPGSGSCP
jgi:MFS family permease